MPTLADLKAQHREWCWKCGEDFDSDFSVDLHNCPGISDVIAALIAAKLEDEARIEAQDLLIKANSLDGLRGLLDWALQQAKNAEAVRAALKGGQP